MKHMSLAEARRRFSELVNEVEGYHEQVTVTKNGQPVAVVVSVYEWELMEDMLELLSDPNIREDLAASRAEIARGETVPIEEVLADARRRVAEEEAEQRRVG